VEKPAPMEAGKSVGRAPVGVQARKPPAEALLHRRARAREMSRRFRTSLRPRRFLLPAPIQWWVELPVDFPTDVPSPASAADAGHVHGARGPNVFRVALETAAWV
jgi:hypothetical protein